MKQGILQVGFILLCLFAAVAPLEADVSYLITSPSQSILQAAATVTNYDTLLLHFNGTVYLTNTLVITHPLVLDGTGFNPVISGNNLVGVITSPNHQLTLKNLTIADGFTTNMGAGIYNGSALTVQNCTFTNNNVAGVAASGGSTYGGAIYNTSGGSAIITGSTFCNNHVIGGSGSNGVYPGAGSAAGGMGGFGGFAYGGAIYAAGNGLYITNCTFFGNKASGGNGGNGGHGGDGYTYQYICDSYCCDSYCFTTCYTYCNGQVNGGPGGQGGFGGDAFGGTICSAGNGVLENVTLAGGAATGGFPGSPGFAGAYGSGNLGGGNIGYGNGGGIYGSGLTLENTILASSVDSTINGNCSGTIIDSGWNLSSDNTPQFYASQNSMLTSSNNAFINLGPLASNGGTTLTMALLPTSSAVRTGSTNGAPLVDQRGQTRKDFPDIGAFETPAIASSIPETLVQTSIPGQRSIQLSFTNISGDSFSVWFSTNVSIFPNQWTLMGYCRENPAGQFKFQDGSITNYPIGFYRIRSP